MMEAAREHATGLPVAGAEADANAMRHAFVSFTVAGQLFGIPVIRVQDILTPDVIARVPLGPPDVRGLINLRGRIVTVIDVRTRLSLTGDAAIGKGMCV